MKLFSIFRDYGRNMRERFMRQSTGVRIVLVLALIAGGWYVTRSITASSSQQIQYQTEVAQKGNLIVSVSASGQISSANSASVTTQTSGVVSKIFVTNGQQVQAGDRIAEVDLDLDGKQRSSQAYAGYLSAKNALDSANASYYSLRSTLVTEWKTYMDKAESSTYTNPDGSPNADQRNLPQFSSTQDNWLAAEAKFKNQQGSVAQAQSSLSSAWASYQQSSPIIYAPISGTVTGLSLQIGAVLSAQTSSTGNSTSQRIANIVTSAAPQVTVSLAQTDVTKVKSGNKATITLDAFPDKTFTGSVISIDTVGSISSGVTSYPAIIKLDSASPDIYSNMSATASIITQVKDDVIVIPSSAIQTTDSAATVRILKNGKESTVQVETGVSNDTQTEILSGITPGTTVITGSTGGTATTGTSTTASPFSAFGNRSFGGGAVIRTERR